MVEIDVSKCKHYDDGICFNEECIAKYCDKCDCWFKQLHRLKAENEALKLKSNMLELKSSSFNLLGLYGRIKQLEQCIGDIEEICKSSKSAEDCCDGCSIMRECEELCVADNSLQDTILNKINEVRDNEVNS